MSDLPPVKPSAIALGTAFTHAISLAGYLTMYVPIFVLIRARVPRFHPSMWLDGLIGTLGTLSAGVAFVLGPYIFPAPGEPTPAGDLQS